MKTEEIKLILVEDEVITAKLEKQHLEKWGYGVDHVSNGEDAVSAVLDGNKYYDLILMDIDLGPGIDGTRATEEILLQNAMKPCNIWMHPAHSVPTPSSSKTSPIPTTGNFAMPAWTGILPLWTGSSRGRTVWMSVLKLPAISQRI